METNPKPIVVNQDKLDILIREVRLLLIAWFILVGYVILIYKIDMQRVGDELVIMSNRLKLEIHNYR